jgi:hypothetical protein
MNWNTAVADYPTSEKLLMYNISSEIQNLIVGWVGFYKVFVHYRTK